jgi:hypothetical protein
VPRKEFERVERQLRAKEREAEEAEEDRQSLQRQNENMQITIDLLKA